MSFLSVKCMTKYFFSDTTHVREAGKAIFFGLGYNKADMVLVSLNEEEVRLEWDGHFLINRAGVIQHGKAGS